MDFSSPLSDHITTATSLALDCLERASTARDILKRCSREEWIPNLMVHAVLLSVRYGQAWTAITPLAEQFARVRPQGPCGNWCCAHAAALGTAKAYRRAIYLRGLCHLTY